MTTTPPAGNPLDDAIADIRRITSEDNLENFSNDELLDACIRLVQADDATREETPKPTLDRSGDFLATLDAARYRADRYDDSERAIITRAITRANVAMAYR